MYPEGEDAHVESWLMTWALYRLIADQALDAARPWKLTQDYLNDLPPSAPLTTLTPLGGPQPPLQALKPNRRTQVMAILNITPDSFSDGGLHTTHDMASLRETVTSALAAGASIIDVGGQSTAPHAPQVTADEEVSRVLPVIELIRSIPEAHKAVISVDTYRASVARVAIEAGAHMINDISAGRLDEAMLPTAAQVGATVCLMHSRGTPDTMNKLNKYPVSIEDGGGLIAAIANELLERIAAAEAAGVRRWRIVLDPGIGFAKVGGQNLEVLRYLNELRNWPGLRGLPWLVGPSRKSFVGHVTGVKNPRERTWGTAATVAAAIHGGADIVRVHDVQEMVQVAAMSDAIWRY
jgi:2-amino-4-hydroxy-6-hydroxymethyldihydropteridine diphosphokinase / dihydropteroate synthase